MGIEDQWKEYGSEMKYYDDHEIGYCNLMDLLERMAIKVR